MKVCCVIDSLGSGGAQRQMTWLVQLLVQRGHDVSLLTYHDFDHYLPLIRSVGVEPICLSTPSKLGRIRRFRRQIKQLKPDVIISFLDVPNMLSVFAALPPRRIPVIVSERIHDALGVTRSNRIRLNSYRFASKVVTNSQAQFDFIADHFPFLKPKLHKITNCVDLDRFRPVESKPHDQRRRILVGASVIPRKNAQSLIRALAQFKDDSVSVDWFGNQLLNEGQSTAQSAYFEEAVELARQLGVDDRFRFHPPVENIHQQFGNYDACCLPSLYEGFPNIICEAMASGLPVLVSRRGDLVELAGEGRGIFFDPEQVESMVEALRHFASLSGQELDQMGARNREYALREFSPDKLADQYEQLMREVTG